MLVRLFLLFLIHQAKGKLVYKCVENEQNSLTFEPAADGVRGRYTLELCTMRYPNVTVWDVSAWYYKGTKDCTEVEFGGLTDLYMHSIGYQNLKRIRHISCNNICISMNLDLIVGGCYRVASDLKNKHTTLQQKRVKFTIRNNLTLSQFEHGSKRVVYRQNGENVKLRWIMWIPIAKPYTMKLERDYDPTDYEVITEKCRLSKSAYEVSCRFAVPDGCYNARLEHDPLWGGIMEQSSYYKNFEYSFCKGDATSPCPCRF